MSSFTVNNLNCATAPQAITTTPGKTLMAWWATTGATTLRRVWLTEIEWGANDVPNATDCNITLTIGRFTADGTGTAIVPRLTDDGGADAAALATYKGNYTAEPTVTANSAIFGKPVNQRGSDKQWWRDKATCPISAAVNLQGWAVRAFSPNYASTVVATASVEE